MATKTIDANMLAKMFLAGAQNIEAKKEFINELNVFPVPDGDTGTNMTLTILSAAKEVSAIANPTMENLAKAIDDAYEAVKKVSFKNAYYRKDIGSRALEAERK